MKNLRLSALCLCALLFNLCTFAQTEKNNNHVNEPDYKKPKLFSNLPDKIPVSVEKINSLLESQVGVATSIKTSGNSEASNKSSAEFDGQVVSKTDKYNGRIVSSVIRSSNFNGATFSLSKIIKEDGTISYTGRIISFQHGDLFILEKQGTEYFLVKKNFYELVNE